jgi:hypothetical protein
MDTLAHALWIGAGLAWWSRRRPVTRAQAAGAVALAVAPDLLQLLPIAGWALLGGGDLAALPAYALAMPGQEPALPPAVAMVTHHLHCIGHSAVIAGAASLLARWRRPALLLPLAGWWSHIVIDVFTHSAAYYPAPVLYPFTQRGFDGLAWTTPGFQAVNYGVLALAALALWLTRPRR